MEQKIEIICLESTAFYKLLDDLLERFKLGYKPQEDKWISGPEAMTKLRIKSKTTLQRLRDEGSIRYSQPDNLKTILYDLDYINEYIEDFVYEPFNMPTNKKRR